MKIDLTPLHNHFSKVYGPSFVSFAMARRGLKPVLIGSGILLQIGMKVFVLTASHVADIIMARRAAIGVSYGYFRDVEVSMKAFDFDSVVMHRLKHIAKLLDVAAFQINIPENSKAMPLQLDKVSLYAQKGDYIFCGAPEESMPPKDKGIQQGKRKWLFEGAYVSYVVQKFKGRTSHITGGDDGVPFTKPYHLLLSDRGSTCFDSGRPKRLHGVSGSGIFSFLQREDRPEIDLESIRLVAIEHQVQNNEYIMGTKIGYLLRMIYDKFKDLPDPLECYSHKRSGIFALNARWKA